MLATRRQIVIGASVASLAAAFRPAGLIAAAAKPHPAYGRSLVIDAQGSLHSFDPTEAPDDRIPPRFLAENLASGVTAVSLTVGPVGESEKAFEDAVGAIAYFQREIEDHPRHFIKVRTYQDLLTAKRTKRVGVIFNFQDTTMIGKKLERVKVFADLGVRVIQLTYNRRNLAGSGCLEVEDKGLTSLGRELVAELNKNGVLVDTSHAGPQTQRDAIKASTKPIAITHSGCRALANRPRNTPDEVLRELAERGGVFGLYFMPFLRLEGQQTSADLIAHIEHALKVAGEDHVGIGSDGGIPAITAMDAYRKHLVEVDERRRKAGYAAPGEGPDVMLIIPEYNHPRRLERLAADLSKRGHPDRIIEKILGANFARLFRETWV